MKRLDLKRTRRISSMAAVLVGAVLVAIGAPMLAGAASFDETIRPDGTQRGFDPMTLSAPDLVIDGRAGILPARDELGIGGSDALFTGSTNVCILIGASETCLSDPLEPLDMQPAPVTFLVTLQITSVSAALGSDPFTLLLRNLDGTAGYDRSYVTVDTNYDEIPGLVIPPSTGFIFDPGNGMNGFDPAIVVQNNIDVGDIRYYLGWTVSLGDSVTFRYDLEQGEIMGFTPSFVWSATPFVVPEPGTALLIGLGLGGLSVAGRRS